MYKKVLLSFSVLIVSLAAGYALAIWQEPTAAPPGGNVEAPINVSSEPQSKSGRITATEFYDWNNPSYYINPASISTIDTLDIGNNLTVGGTVSATNYPPNACAEGYSIRVINFDGSVTCELDDDSGGAITNITAGTCLTGGGSSGNVTVNLGTAYKRTVANKINQYPISSGQNIYVVTDWQDCPAGEYVCAIRIYVLNYVLRLEVKCCGE